MCQPCAVTARRRILAALGVVALAAVVVVGLGQARREGVPSSAAPSPGAVSGQLRGSPPPLAALHTQAAVLLGGDTRTVRARLASLRGYPVVVNKWGSWCPPCVREFPAFQTASAALGRRIAFLGIDSVDPRPGALAFLREHPVSYPSYVDADGTLGTTLTHSTAAPVTVFYDRRGREAFIHQGPYLTPAALERDVSRYVP